MENNNDISLSGFIDSWGITEQDNIILCDVDGTIFRDSFFLEILNGLIEIKNARTSYEEHEKILTMWKDRELLYDEYLGEAIEIFLDLIVGVSQEDFDAICVKAVNNSMNRTYVWTKKYLKSFQENGGKVFLVSGSPMEIVSYFAKVSGFDGAVGSYYFVDENNRKTGDRIPFFSNQAKLDVLNYIRETYNPRSITGIGDTNGDFSMITTADYGFAINPSRELAVKLSNEAMTKNMNHVKVILERKDLQLEMGVNELISKII